MYYVDTYYNAFVIRHTVKEEVFFGPFESNSDAFLMSEMFNMGKITFNGDDTYGEKDSQEPYTVHQHIAE